MKCGVVDAFYADAFHINKFHNKQACEVYHITQDKIRFPTSEFLLLFIYVQWTLENLLSSFSFVFFPNAAYSMASLFVHFILFFLFFPCFSPFLLFVFFCILSFPSFFLCLGKLFFFFPWTFFSFPLKFAALLFFALSFISVLMQTVLLSLPTACLLLPPGLAVQRFPLKLYRHIPLELTSILIF